MLYVAEERTAGGRLFHALGPATANARSPIVDRRVAGTTRSVDDVGWVEAIMYLQAPASKAKGWAHL